MQVPLHQPLHELLHLRDRAHPTPEYRQLFMNHQIRHVEAHAPTLAHEHDASPHPRHLQAMESRACTPAAVNAHIRGDTVIRPRTGIAEIVRVLLLVLRILLPDGPLGALNTQLPRERDARRVKLDAEHAGAHVLRDECDAKADGAHAGDEDAVAT